MTCGDAANAALMPTAAHIHAGLGRLLAAGVAEAALLEPFIARALDGRSLLAALVSHAEAAQATA
jgi:hypothetical protein